jgi:competence protein ComEA
MQLTLTSYLRYWGVSDNWSLIRGKFYSWRITMIRALFITLLFLLPFTTQATTSSAQANNDSRQNTSTKMHGNTESRQLEDEQKKSAVTKNLKAVNVNSASAKDLAASLPGIGDAKAKAIVDYRKKNGKFKSASDLAKVPGLGDKSVGNMKKYLKY